MRRKRPALNVIRENRHVIQPTVQNLANQNRTDQNEQARASGTPEPRQEKPKKTYVGVGGMQLELEAENDSQVKYFSDTNRDGIIGFPDTKVPFEATVTGMVRVFVDNGKTYTARFQPDGTFKGYWTGKSGEPDHERWIHPSESVENKSKEELDFQQLWTNYPGTDDDPMTVDEIYALAGGRTNEAHVGDPIKFANTCPIRVSEALNMSGHPIKPLAHHEFGGDYYPGKSVDGKVMYYYFRVPEMGEYITNTYGEPDIEFSVDKTMSESSVKKKLYGFKGIIQMDVSGWSNAVGHYTLWNMNKVAHGDYMTEEYVKGTYGENLKKVKLWILNY